MPIICKLDADDQERGREWSARSKSKNLSYEERIRQYWNIPNAAVVTGCSQESCLRSLSVRLHLKSHFHWVRDSILTDCQYLVTGEYHPLTTTSGGEDLAQDTDSFVSPEFEDWMDTPSDSKSFLGGVTSLYALETPYEELFGFIMVTNLDLTYITNHEEVLPYKNDVHLCEADLDTVSK